MTSGLSLRAVTRNTCYGRVCLIGHWCYGQRVNLPVLGEIHPHVTSLLQVWGLRRWVTQNLMAALHVATSMRRARSDEIFYSRFSLSHFFQQWIDKNDCQIEAFGSALSILTISSCSERYSSYKRKWLHLLIVDIKYSLIGQSSVSLNKHKTALSNQNSTKKKLATSIKKRKLQKHKT